MRFLFRADASLAIGSGHIMRCLTLARALRDAGQQVHFVCRDLKGHLFDTVCAHGFGGTLLPAPPEKQPENPADAPPHAHWLPVPQLQDAADTAAVARTVGADWLVVDHYALAAPWQRQLRAACPQARILVLDDLADRAHAADLLLDQNFGRCAADYQTLLPESCTVLAGTRYALLRPEFAQWRHPSLARRQTFSGSLKLLVNLGGVDKDNHTLRVLQALADYARRPSSGSLNVTVVMGATAPHSAAVQAFAERAPYPCRVLVNAADMAALMAEADIAVGAAGSTSWERCCLGLPTILLVLADNQRRIADALHAAGAAFCLPAGRIDADDVAALLDQPAGVWRQTSARAAESADGLGCTRVVRHLLEPVSGSLKPGAPACEPRPALRQLTEADLETVRHWRNHPDIRRWMFSQDEISADQQRQWFANRQHQSGHHLWLYTLDGMPQGFVQFTETAPQRYDWGFYLAPDAPRGYGTVLGRLALQRAFAELRAQTVDAQVLSFNTRSLALHRKLGFAELPAQPAAHRIGDTAYDVHPFTLSAEQFAY